MLQAMNTGHDGSLSTVHANSPRDALSRLETMVLMAGFDLPIRAIRQQVASALDLIVHIERVEDGSRHVTAITEVQRMESDVITLQELFEFKMSEVNKDGVVVGELVPTGLRPLVPPEVREARRRAAARPVRYPERPRDDRARSRPGPMKRASLLILAAAIARARRGRRRGRTRRRHQHHAGERASSRTSRSSSRFPRRPRSSAARSRSPRTAPPSPACSVVPESASAGTTASSASRWSSTRATACRARRSQAAMNAARAFVAQRAPGQQIAVRHVQLQVQRRAAADEDQRHDRRGGRPCAESRLRHAHVRQRVVGDRAARRRRSSTPPRSSSSPTGPTPAAATSLKKTLAAARAAHVRIYTVGLHSKEFDPSSLQALAAGANGAYAEAEKPSELTGLFHRLGAQLAGQYLVRYQSFAGPKQPVTVRIRVQGHPGRREEPLRRAAARADRRFRRPSTAPSSLGIIISPYTAIGVVLACALLAGVALASALTPTHNHLRKRMAEFVSMATPREDRPALGAEPRSGMLGGTERSLESHGLVEELQGGARDRRDQDAGDRDHRAHVHRHDRVGARAQRRPRLGALRGPRLRLPVRGARVPQGEARSPPWRSSRISFRTACRSSRRRSAAVTASSARCRWSSTPPGSR